MKVAMIGTTAACVLGFRAGMIIRLVEQGCEVLTYAVGYCETTESAVRALGAVPVRYRLSRGGLNPLSDLYRTWKLSRCLRRHAPDLVFSYFAKPVVFGTLAAVLAGVGRRVGMLEGLGYSFTQHPKGISLKARLIRLIQLRLYALTFPMLERLVFLNPDDPVDLLVRHGLKTRCVSVLGGIGVDLDDYPYSVPPSTPFSFIFVGRLLAEKGVGEYVQAARAVKLKHPSVQFYLLGTLDDCNPGSLTQEHLDELVSQGVVIHAGHVDDVAPWLARASVFVLPSYREGVPRSTQEAMAMGRPVITTDVPGCRETVIDGLNGFLIPPWSADALEQKMLYFIECPEKAEEMGQHSYRMAKEKFDAGRVNARLVDLLQLKCSSGDKRSGK